MLVLLFCDFPLTVHRRPLPEGLEANWRGVFQLDTAAVDVILQLLPQQDPIEVSFLKIARSFCLESHVVM